MSKEEKFKKYEHVVMKDLTERQYKTILNKYYSIEGRIINLENEIPWYNACKACNKKVQLKGDSARCDKCNTDDTKYTQKYMGRFKVTDSTDTIIVTIFENLETITGCSASEYARSPEKVKKYTYKIC
ncbi:replication factor A 51 kDa subunit-like [Macadamia integrifolia]|uniref:replication factor A 51 kDa subunit-like n=1 Tax=Macadamia integrifolia TaxID=60698 RepID=UPI001C4F747C|nr:replication factor A 51 kDa subunit-like [Macadamia integrifolia]